MDEALRSRLEQAGVDPDGLGDPAGAFLKLHQTFGRRATVLDRYAIESAHTGRAVGELTTDERRLLGREVLKVQGFHLVGEVRSDPIEVVAFDDDWPVTFVRWRDRIARALGPVAKRIEHVGSTAVAGLAAKPIVDIQVSVADAEDESRYVASIEAIGVMLRSRDPRHRYFRPPPHMPREIQLHVCDVGGRWEREHLLFRDYLRGNATVRRAYQSLKVRLARHYHDDRLAYTDAKTDFILNALSDAEAWAGDVGWSANGGS